jgi:hypothetical protein
LSLILNAASISVSAVQMRAAAADDDAAAIFTAAAADDDVADIDARADDGCGTFDAALYAADKDAFDVDDAGAGITTAPDEVVDVCIAADTRCGVI